MLSKLLKLSAFFLLQNKAFMSFRVEIVRHARDLVPVPDIRGRCPLNMISNDNEIWSLPMVHHRLRGLRVAMTITLTVHALDYVRGSQPSRRGYDQSSFCFEDEDPEKMY